MQLLLSRAYGGKVEFQFHYLVVVLGHLLQEVLCLQFCLQFRHLLANVGQSVAVDYLSAHEERLRQCGHSGIALVQFADGVGLTCQGGKGGVNLPQGSQFLRVVAILLHHLVEGMESQQVGRDFGEVLGEGLTFLFAGHLYLQGGIQQGTVLCGRALQTLLQGDGARLSLGHEGEEEEEEESRPTPSLPVREGSRMYC